MLSDYQQSSALHRRKLVTEQDEAKRKMIFRLLAEERAKLTAQNPPLAAMLALLARAT
jgi:hypothetical protein